MDKTKKVIASAVDFVSDGKCKKKGISSNFDKGDKCFQVKVDKKSTCMRGNPIFGFKKNEVILQGLSVTSTEPCTSAPQPMTSIQPYVTWINTFILDCGSLEKIQNGKSVLDKESISTVGATASVTCDAGYLADKKKITCLKSGKWEIATCTLKDCGPVQNIGNGKINLDKKSESTVGSTATVECDPGYERNKKKVNCLETGKWEKAKCQIKDCGAVEHIRKGKIVLDKKSITTFGATATVTCNPGYIANQEKIVCLESGEWEQAECIINDCGPVQIIKEGEIILEDSNSTIGATAIVSCFPGYKANYKEKIVCLNSGKWEKSWCIRKDCGSSLNVQNGTLIFGTTTFESIAVVACDTGFFAKKPSIECLKSGRWETPCCIIKDCGSSLTVNNGTLSYTTTTYGSTAAVVCDGGFDPLNASIICLASGMWETPLCIIKDCGSSLTVSNGNLIFTTTTYGSSASVNCFVGYSAKKDNIYCKANGRWQTPKCTIKDCGSSITVNNGTISFTTTTFGSNVSVSCDVGYTANKETITCQDTGIWETPTCTIKDCGSSLTVNNGTLTFTTTTYGSTASVNCDTGFDASNASISCLATGVWETPFCIIKDCGPNVTVTNGTRTFTTTTYGSTASLQCDTGFDANNASISCLASGNWETTLCTIKDCGPNVTVTNGTLTFTTTTYGSTASLQCDTGFDANNASISCLASGHWETPLCTIKDCGALPNLGNGTTTLADETTYLSNATFTCDEGSAPTPSNGTITCLASAVWETPTCTFIDCGNPGSLYIIQDGRTTYLARAIYAKGKDRCIVCERDGEWVDGSPC